MKLCILDNGKARNLSAIRSVIDFFFPYTNTLRLEAFTSTDGTHLIRRFYTFRALVVHYLTLPSLVIRESWILRGFAPRLVSRIGAMAFDTFDSNRTEAAATTLTVSHTATGSNLVAAVFSNQTHYASGVTYAAVGMTNVLQLTPSAGYHMEGWQIANPTTGAQNVVATWTSGSGRALAIYTFSGADTTTPIGASNSADDVSTPTSVSLTTQTSNAFIVDFVSGDQGINGTVFAPDASQTTGVNDKATTDGSHDHYGSSYKQGSGSVTMQWTYTNSPRGYYGILAMEVRNPTVAASPTRRIFPGIIR